MAAPPGNCSRQHDLPQRRSHQDDGPKPGQRVTRLAPGRTTAAAVSPSRAPSQSGPPGTLAGHRTTETPGCQTTGLRVGIAAGSRTRPAVSRAVIRHARRTHSRSIDVRYARQTRFPMQPGSYDQAARGPDPISRTAGPPGRPAAGTVRQPQCPTIGLHHPVTKRRPAGRDSRASRRRYQPTRSNVSGVATASDRDTDQAHSRPCNAPGSGTGRASSTATRRRNSADATGTRHRTVSRHRQANCPDRRPAGPRPVRASDAGTGVRNTRIMAAHSPSRPPQAPEATTASTGEAHWQGVSSSARPGKPATIASPNHTKWPARPDSRPNPAQPAKPAAKSPGPGKPLQR